MANHVSSYIQFDNLTEQTEKMMEEIFDNSMNKESSECLYELYSHVHKQSFNEEEHGNISWWSDEVGSKWLVIEDAESDSLAITTAWTPPYGFYKTLYKMVAEHSPEAIMWVRYDDEMPNFIGCWGMAPGDYDYEECLDEEYYEKAIGSLPYIEDENGESEWNDEWWDKLDEFYDGEYKYFIEGYNEWRTESEQTD
ncbi:MAG: hypothetical protein VW270_09685 [Candidatus Poseidoniales archaeon]